MFDSIHEECGVFGIYDAKGERDVTLDAYMALFALQPELFEQAASLCRAEEASAPPSGDQPRK